MKSLILLIALGFIVSNAFASKARLEALGEDFLGSHYIDDDKNVFLNPAELNNHYDFMVFDFGDTSNLNDGETTPKATGGLVKKRGAMVWGMFFGHDSNTVSELRTTPLLLLVSPGVITGPQYTAISARVRNTNTVDLFYAREGAFKWGVKFNYSASSDESVDATNNFEDTSQEGSSISIGAIKGDWDFSTIIGLSNKSSVKDIVGSSTFDYDFEGKGGLEFNIIKRASSGANYYLKTRNLIAEQDGLPGGEDEWTITRAELGYGRVSKANDKLDLFYKGWVYMDSQTSQGFVEDRDTKEQYLGLLVGMETSVKDWLTLRGSVQNKFLGTEEVDGDSKTIANAVNVNIGTSIIFGDLSVDGLIGNDGNGDGTSGDDLGVLRTDSLLSRVSMTYKF